MAKKGFLEYEGFIWYVLDLDAVVEDYLKRINRKVPLGTEWDYEKEDKRNIGDYDTPRRPEYKLPSGLAVDFLSMLGEVEEKIAKMETERESIEKEMKKLRKTSPKSFIEAVDAVYT